jgi:hypothetical protein
MTDHETILTALADGLIVGKAARALGLTETEVRAALRETTDNVRNGGAHLREIECRLSAHWLAIAVIAAGLGVLAAPFVISALPKLNRRVVAPASAAPRF